MTLPNRKDINWGSIHPDFREVKKDQESDEFDITKVGQLKVFNNVTFPSNHVEFQDI